MVDRLAKIRAQGRQRRTKNSGKVTQLNGVAKQQRQTPNARQKQQTSSLNRLLLDPVSTENKEQPHTREQNIFNALPLTLIGIDSSKQICQWNRQVEKLLGISAEIALGNPWMKLLAELPLPNETFELVVASQTMVRLDRLPWRRAEQSRLLELTLYPSGDLFASGVLVQIDDVTEQAQRDELTMQQEKMVSVGNLAAGVAQAIDHPISGILQNLQVIRNRLHPNLPKNIELAQSCEIDIDQLDNYLHERGIHAILNAVIESGQQAAHVVHSMLNFSHKDDSGFQYQRLSSLLDKAVELATSNYNQHDDLDFRKIEIIRHFEAELPSLYCSPGQLQQVFLNLLMNGANAMSQRLRFWEKNRDTLPMEEKPRFILRLKKQQNALRCEIEDNGCGMKEEVRKRIFDPFYTTQKSGTGLGMSICYFIVSKNHNGRMSVDSRPDCGSKFTLELPLLSPTENPCAEG